MLPRIITRGDHEAARLLAREGIRQLNILKNLMSFGNLKQDVRRVRFTNGSEIICRSIFGIDDVQIYVPKEVKKWETKVECYVYVTISNYVTVWDLETGEVAEDIVGDDKKIVKFPCHKDAISNWLKGFTDRPTREILNDNPRGSRDYIEDNHKDIGDENRLEYAEPRRPDYSCYYGIEATATFQHAVDGDYENNCPPTDTGQCHWHERTEKKGFDQSDVTRYDADLCTESFYIDDDMGDAWGDHADFPKGKYCYYAEHGHGGTGKYFEIFLPITKHLYLGKYPCPLDIDYNSDISGRQVIEYTTPGSAVYPKPINLKSAYIQYNCSSYYSNLDWDVELHKMEGGAHTIETPLGKLIIDGKPADSLPDEYKEFYNRIEDAITGDDCWSLDPLDGSYSTKEDAWFYSCDPPSHGECWRLDGSGSGINKFSSESNRLAISWCGSPKPLEETNGWYRVMLFFYTGKLHKSGHHTNYFCDNATTEMMNGGHCPDEAWFEDQNNCEDPEYNGYWWNVTPIDEVTTDRYSSVQATIELENPEEYPKKIDTSKYERPEDFDVNLEKYECLCAFPERPHGTPIDNKKGICYPYDGSYRIKSLEKAVKELINTCYVDGSDDKLLVYLYKRKIRRKKIK